MQTHFTLTDLINPEFYILMGGLWIVLLIIFAETGLFIGFFFPGDSLLFVSGIYANELIEKTFGSSKAHASVWALIFLTAASAIAGNIVGYKIGSLSKNFFYHAKDRWYYKKKYIRQAHDFYEKHGAFAISFARFLPIIRTFVPVVAGIVDMSFRSFLFYSVIGGIVWPMTLQLLGYYMYNFLLDSFGIDIKNSIEFIIIFIVLITTVPVFWNLFKKRKSGG